MIHVRFSMILFLLLPIFVAPLPTMLNFLHNISVLPYEIVQQFTEYDIIIHFDNATCTDLNFLLPSVIEMKAMRSVNYIGKDKNRVLNRPKGLRYIHMVFLTNFVKFRKFSCIDYNLNHRDVILMLTNKKSMKKLLEIDGVSRAGGLFIFNLNTRKLYTTCFYCGKYNKKIVEIQEYRDLTNFINTFRNFRGQLFRVAYANFFPFFVCEQASVRCIPIGSEGELLKTLSVYLNFQYELVLFNKTDGGDGQWEAMIDAVSNRRIDFAVGGISVSGKRGEITDFTKYIRREGFRVLFINQEHPWTTVRNVILLFQWPILVVLCICIILIGLISKLSANVSLKSNKTPTFFYIKLALNSLVEQPTIYLYNRFNWGKSVTLMVLLWWMLSLSFTTYYKSQLASFLIKPKCDGPTQISELVEQGYTFQANNEDWSVLRNNFEESLSPVYKKVLSRTTNDLEFCDSVRYALNNKVGVIDEESPLDFELEKSCAKHLTALEHSKLKLLHENLFPGGYHAWSMQRSYPFLSRFSECITRLRATGLVSHWYDTVSPLKLSIRNEKRPFKEYKPLKLLSLLAPFVVLIAGLIVGVCAFFVELYKYSM